MQRARWLWKSFARILPSNHRSGLALSLSVVEDVSYYLISRPWGCVILRGTGRVFFTLNRSFYPSTSSTTSVRADYLVVLLRWAIVNRTNYCG